MSREILQKVITYLRKSLTLFKMAVASKSSYVLLFVDTGMSSSFCGAFKMAKFEASLSTRRIIFFKLACAVHGVWPVTGKSKKNIRKTHFFII